MLKQHLSLENIQQNEVYLSKNYAPELAQVYREGLISYVDKFKGRNHYQTTCTYMRGMKKLGGHEEVKELKTFLGRNIRNARL